MVIDVNSDLNSMSKQMAAAKDEPYLQSFDRSKQVVFLPDSNVYSHSRTTSKPISSRPPGVTTAPQAYVGVPASAFYIPSLDQSYGLEDDGTQINYVLSYDDTTQPTVS